MDWKDCIPKSCEIRIENGGCHGLKFCDRCGEYVCTGEAETRNGVYLCDDCIDIYDNEKDDGNDDEDDK